jgi:hypothetical protein
MALNLILFYVVRDMSNANQGLIDTYEFDVEDNSPEVGADSAGAPAPSHDSEWGDHDDRDMRMSRTISRSSMALEYSEKMISNVRSISVA